MQLTVRHERVIRMCSFDRKADYKGDSDRNLTL